MLAAPFDHDPEARRAQLAAALASVRSRIADACAAAGRARSEVTLVAVTKTYPASDVLLLAELGVLDIGENRDQEAAAKAAQVAAAGAEVRWHFVGQLQRNKARSVVRYAHLVHSVDSTHLARALDTAAARHRDRPLDVLVQVSLDGDARRGGALPEPRGELASPAGPAQSALPEVPADRRLADVAAAVADSPSLRLRGLMAVAPLGWAPAVAFERLGRIAGWLRQSYPQATVISAGMSEDLEAAIAYGATHVRIGSALLGKRSPGGVA